MNDVIAAISTPCGTGAVSMVRVSGQGVASLLGGAFVRGKLPIQLQERVATLATLVNGEGDAVDEVLVTYFAGPRSYTGEDTIEIAGHGGALITQRVLEVVLAKGARLAREGEFSERAYTNGKLDLTQAEAVMDLIAAQSDFALVAAREQLSGGISQAVGQMRGQLIGLIGELEAYIDFPDEDISPDTGKAFLGRIDSCIAELERMLATEERGRMLREGVRVVIVGLPNAGKSSLLNRMLGFDRAIVSDIAGTTRDTVEEVLHLGGVGVRLIDTAGLRDAGDEIEREGIARSHRQIEVADVIVEVVDGSVASTTKDGVESGARRYLRAINKSDLGLHRDFAELGNDDVVISCSTDSGIAALIERLAQLVQPGATEGSGLVAINQRHRECLSRAHKALVEAKSAFVAGYESEFVAVDLREALEAIGDVTGRVDTEEVLGEIFGRFCIGK